MDNRCPQQGCPVPKGLCREHLVPEYKKCEHWMQAAGGLAVASTIVVRTKNALPWSGTALEPNDLGLVGNRSNPVIIGMIGTADAGKTSYLSMLFRLLFNGRRLEDWHFAGSYTLSAWETLAQYMLIRKGGEVMFPPPTPSNSDYYSFLHLALRKHGLLKDILFADSSGEVFLRWANDIEDSGSENARWIYRHSSAFVFFVDCEALINRKGGAVPDILQMAHQLAAGLDGRPVVVVWSKADRIGEIKANIRRSLEESLVQIFKGALITEVSNIAVADAIVRQTPANLHLVGVLLAAIDKRHYDMPRPTVITLNDYFLTYRGDNAIR